MPHRSPIGRAPSTPQTLHRSWPRPARARVWARLGMSDHRRGCRGQHPRRRSAMLEAHQGMTARPPAPAAFRSSSWLRGRAPLASPLVHELRYGGDECRRGDTECYAAIELCGLSLTVQRRASRFRIERRVQDRAGGVPGVRLPYPEGTREMVGRRPAQVGEVAPGVELRGHGDEGWPAP